MLASQLAESVIKKMQNDASTMFGTPPQEHSAKAFKC
jgi:hypothetical protein